tara:strand:+ start:201 stop:1205 length:1005 start_codon:yes stop_codon:yes gene_type:complete
MAQKPNATDFLTNLYNNRTAGLSSLINPQSTQSIGQSDMDKLNAAQFDTFRSFLNTPIDETLSIDITGEDLGIGGDDTSGGYYDGSPVGEFEKVDLTDTDETDDEAVDEENYEDIGSGYTDDEMGVNIDELIENITEKEIFDLVSGAYDDSQTYQLNDETTQDLQDLENNLIIENMGNEYGITSLGEDYSNVLPSYLDLFQVQDGLPDLTDTMGTTNVDTQALLDLTTLGTNAVETTPTLDLPKFDPYNIVDTLGTNAVETTPTLDLPTIAAIKQLIETGVTTPVVDAPLDFSTPVYDTLASSMPALTLKNNSPNRMLRTDMNRGGIATLKRLY